MDEVLFMHAPKSDDHCHECPNVLSLSIRQFGQSKRCWERAEKFFQECSLYRITASGIQGRECSARKHSFALCKPDAAA